MANDKSTSSTPRDLQLAFDVGHSSIGWAVLQALSGQSPKLLGCGSVIFPADDCLASQRRGFRRQRRHIRSTRQRIARMALLIEHLLNGTEPALAARLAIYRESKRHHELTGNGHAAPWLLAARVLRGGPLLTWPELWDVLRWYAHNRGYDGNKSWSNHTVEPDEAAAEQEDTEKVEKARGLLADFATKYGRSGSMAEVWCDLSDLDPLGTKISTHLPDIKKRPKAQNAAFPREQVETEVTSILRAHFDHLPGVDATFERALMHDWQALPAPNLSLPLRYQGGLLFGQLVPRFENRIIARCPITFEHIYQRELSASGDETLAKDTADKLSKVPSADCIEFFRYRWTMQLANIQIATADPKNPRRLTALERQTLDADMKTRGAFTKGDFKKAVRALTGNAADNLDQMLVHPDAEKALVTDPAQKLIASSELVPYFRILPDHIQQRVRGQLRKGKRLTLGSIRAYLENTDALTTFDSVLNRQLDAAQTKRTKKSEPPTRAAILKTDFQIAPVSGRAPHSREVMQSVIDFVLSTVRHPAEGSENSTINGPLFRSQAIRQTQLKRAIDEQTNNHLVRHRLRLLDRLHRDILKSYADEQLGRTGRITIEVNRDLRELSGKTNKQIAQDLGQRLSNFKSVTDKLEKELVGKNIPITPGLIRKARIAEDLGWTCPYTGKAYDIYDLIHRRVDKDHIIPRADRASDSLDSLVITFSEVNRMKGKRTAALFIEQEQGKAVTNMTNLFIKPLATFTKDTESLETFKGHDDETRRKKNRKRLLALRDYVEKEFVPGDLTQTSQLVRLGAQTLERSYLDMEEKPVITSLPGSVTGSVRKSWHLLPLLKFANPQVLNPADLDENGKPKVRTKTEIRDITHLHHALDACTIAFASLFLPRDGDAWQLLTKRRLNAEEQIRARAYFKNYVQFDQEGRLQLLDLPQSLKNQIARETSRCRVVQHIPVDFSGLRAELNAWRVVGFQEGEVSLRQRMRQPDGTRSLKEKTEKASKLIGLQPGKLHQLKAALIIGDNYGLALDPEPTIIPFHQVWVRLRELKRKNGGKPIRILRNGMLIRVARGKYIGIWRIFSAKNNASGMALDMGRPDIVRLRNKAEGHKINVLLASLLRDGLEILDTGFVGVDATSIDSIDL